MNELKIIQLDPKQLQDTILKGVQDQIQELAQHFQPKEPTEFLTRNEVKDFLKCDLSTVHNYTKRGKLKAYGIGNRVYYKRSEVEASLKPLRA